MKHSIRTTVILILGLFGTRAEAQFLAQKSPETAGDRASEFVVRDMVLDPAGFGMWQLGVFGGADYNMHHGGFTTTQGSFICCVANSGTGFGAAGGIKAIVRLADQWMISPRIVYEGRNGSFDGNPESYPILGQQNTMETVLLTKQLKATIATVGADLLVGWYPMESEFYVTAGPSVASIVNKRFVQTEHVQSPNGVTYVGGATDQVVLDSAMDITNAVQVLAKVGVGYQFRLSNFFSVNPELVYGYPLTKLSKFYNWAGSSLQGTLGILFTP